MAVLTRGLTTVRAEFNSVFPDRDKSSDGWIGDQAHQGSVSGHNPDKTGRAEYKDGDAKDEVRAIDVDKDLRSSVTMEQVIQYLVKKARSGAYVPFRYIIYNRRIWSRSDGWKTRAYTGSNPHTGHAHLSGDYTQTADEWTGSLGLASLVSRPKPPTSPAPSDWGKEIVSKMKTLDLSKVTSSGSTQFKGEDVERLQGLLLAAGYGPSGLVGRNGRPDGIAGPGTRAALGSFQKATKTGRGGNTATPDYVAGKATWSKLLGV